MKTAAAAGLVLLLAACSSEPELTATPVSEPHVSDTDDVLVWAAEFGADDLELVEEGIAVSHETRTLYALDCERAEELVVEGAEFGPVPYDEGGDGTPGFTKVCRP